MSSGWRPRSRRVAPGPTPSAPPVIVSHGAWLVAVQVQPADTAMATVPAPPPNGTLADDGVSVAGHWDAANSWP